MRDGDQTATDGHFEHVGRFAHGEDLDVAVWGEGPAEALVGAVFGEEFFVHLEAGAGGADATVAEFEGEGGGGGESFGGYDLLEGW